MRYWIGSSLLVISMLLGQSFAEELSTTSSWESIALRSLQENVINLPSGTYLVAGKHQFRSPWTRDFCFSIRGLLAAGRPDVVRSQLSTLLDDARFRDGLVPRAMDSIPVQARVIFSSLMNIIGWDAYIPVTDPMIPQYIDEHGSDAIDSNMLVILGALDYVEATHDVAWWNEHEDDLIAAFHYYDNHLDETSHLITQSQYSDWQDSVKREGVTFFSNLLYALVLKRLATYPRFEVSVDWRKRREALVQIFRDPILGIYRSMMEQPYFSLDGNLLALEWGLFDDQPEVAQKLYQELKSSVLWSGPAGIPGFNTFPNYPVMWRSPSVQLAGLGHYHDSIYWSWLVAISAKVALKQGDRAESERITAVLAKAIERDGSVGEIYKPEPELPLWRSSLYRSEAPFSWGSAMVLELATALRSHP